MGKPSSSIRLDTEAWDDAPKAAVESLRALGDRDITIDGTDAGAASAQIAQILLAAQASARAAGCAFTLANPSDALRESLTGLGLGRLIEEPAP